MFIECPICKSDQEESGFLFQESLKSQEESVFLFKESIKSPHRADCIVYQNFLNIVSKKTNLTTTIIDILYFNDQLSAIVNINTTWCESIKREVTSIPKNVVFKENYEKSLGFIFANIIQLNKKYNIKLSISKSKYKKEDTELLLTIEIKDEDFIPYDINLLNEKEKNNLFEKITNDKNKLFNQKNKGLFSFEVVYEQKEYKLCITSNFNLNASDPVDFIYLTMEQKIEELYNEIIEIYKYFKEQNKTFFERPLLEIEIKYF